MDISNYDSLGWKDLLSKTKSWNCEFEAFVDPGFYNYEMQLYRKTKEHAYFRSKEGHTIRVSTDDISMFNEMKSGYKNGEWYNCKFEMA